MKLLLSSRYFTLAFSIVTLFTQNIVSQESDQVIAKVGEKNIYSSEISQRYEFIPQLGRETSKGNLELVKEILYTVVAEKLWAQEASNIGLDKNDFLISTFSFLEKMFVRDALYKNEITGVISFTEKEINNAILLNSKTLYLNYIIADSETNIVDISDSLNNNSNFDKLLSTRPERDYQDKPIKVTFGDYDKNTEKFLYMLQPGEYTSPIQMDDGWYIFMLKRVEISAEDHSFDSIEDVKKVLSSRQSESRYKAYYKKFFGSKSAKTNGTLFKELVAQLELLYEEKSETLPEDDKAEYIYFDNMDAMRMEILLGEKTINSPFVVISDKTISLKKVFRELIFHGLKIRKNAFTTIAMQLNRQIKLLTEKEFLAEEAYSRGFASDLDVVKSMEMWKNYYLGRAYREKFEKEIESKIIKNDESIPGKVKFDKMIENTIELANSKNITINEDVLNNFELTNLNMIVYRYFGFGGKLLAVPMSPPFATWFEKWKQQQKTVF